MPKKANAALTIGDVAKISGVSIETIRYYERIGVLAKPARGPNGFRNYASKEVDAIIFINRSRNRISVGHDSRVDAAGGGHRSLR